MDMYTSNITRSYVDLRTIYLGFRDPRLKSGKVRVVIEGDERFSAEGTLNTQGGLSGMAKLYKTLNLKEGDTLSFSVIGDNEIRISSPITTPNAGEQIAPFLDIQYTPVFEAKRFKHVHLEAFRPENLNHWEPQTEPDIYLAFGVLQQFTDFQYCCGVSTALLKKLNANYDRLAKPDAILIDRRNDQYLMAEWKIYSSDFKSNHRREDVDVLVCWEDDETDRGKLPQHILALRAIAQTAGSAALLDN